jgi:hypothetical protein
MDNVRREASRNFSTKKKKGGVGVEYLENKINELETNSKNMNIRDLYRGINEFKKGYQPRTNMVKEENGDLLADCRVYISCLYISGKPMIQLGGKYFPRFSLNLVFQGN